MVFSAIQRLRSKLLTASFATSFSASSFCRSEFEQNLAQRIVFGGELGDPFHHHLGIAQFAEAGEQTLTQLLHLPPCRIGIDREKSVGHGAAAADGNAQIVHRIGSEILAGLVALFEDAIGPVGKSRLLVGRVRSFRSGWS